MTEADVERDLAELVHRTVEALAGVPDEALGEVGKTLLGRQPKLVPAGRAWRLGVLLIDRKGRLYSTGTVTRAIEPLRAVTNRSAEAELRREERRAAVRGHFTEGEVVNFGHTLIDLESAPGPLSVIDGVVFVRWSSTGIPRPLADYLADRLAVLDDPAG